MSVGAYSPSFVELNYEEIKKEVDEAFSGFPTSKFRMQPLEWKWDDSNKMLTKPIKFYKLGQYGMHLGTATLKIDKYVQSWREVEEEINLSLVATMFCLESVNAKGLHPNAKYPYYFCKWNRYTWTVLFKTKPNEVKLKFFKDPISVTNLDDLNKMSNDPEVPVTNPHDKVYDVATNSILISNIDRAFEAYLSKNNIPFSVSIPQSVSATRSSPIMKSSDMRGSSESETRGLSVSVMGSSDDSITTYTVPKLVLKKNQTT